MNLERPRARFSTWYEFFPRSCGEGLNHGTFADCEKRIESIAEMGFDVAYLPPIHPIGFTNRKGKNNSVQPEPGDCGSPWAIGSEEGGHKSTHPELGTLKDFQKLRQFAREKGVEIALDLAYQCSPDHPYVTQHPEWFRRRPDGSIQYAENPPKKYEDIYPFDFETDDPEPLWEELKDIIQCWISQGVTQGEGKGTERFSRSSTGKRDRAFLGRGRATPFVHLGKTPRPFFAFFVRRKTLCPFLIPVLPACSGCKKRGKRSVPFKKNAVLSVGFHQQRTSGDFDRKGETTYFESGP